MRGPLIAVSSPHAPNGNTVERTEEAGERVISHVRFSGRHTTSDRGAAASGRLMQATGEIVHELHEGRITDAWSVLRWR